MTPSTSSRLFNVLFWTTSLVLGVFIVLTVVSDVRIKRSTGGLTITTFASNASISISSNNKGAVIVGTGTAKLRLSPGSYQITASSNGSTSTGRAVVRLGASTTVHLAKTNAAPVPSPDNITFSGIDALVQRGITAKQSANLRTLFFKYKQNAKAISIKTSSITQGPRDSSDDNAPFTLNFTVTIDSDTYDASIVYTDLENLELRLLDTQTGDQVYDATSVQSIPNA